MKSTTGRQVGGTVSWFRGASWVGVAGPIAFTIAWLVAGALTPGYSHVRAPISQLAALGAPYPAIQQAGFSAAAAALACGLFFMLMILVAFVVASRVSADRSRPGVARFSRVSGTLSLVLFVVYGSAISSVPRLPVIPSRSWRSP